MYGCIILISMLNKIIDFSIRNKLIIGLLLLVWIAWGIYESTLLPIDAVPDITNNQVQVITIAPSYGATDIERLVTFPIEQNCSNISGTQEIRSFSRFGLSLVTIVFKDDIDIYWARQQVSERIQKAKEQIPKGIGSPELGPITSGLGEIYQYVLKPKKGYEHKYGPMELRTIQDWIVRRQLLGVEGVAEVSSFGGYVKQLEIAIDPAALNAYGISIQDVFTTLEKNNQNTGGAYIEKGPTVLYIKSEGLLQNTDQILQLPIIIPNRVVPLYIRDVAKVQWGYATRYGAISYNDEGEVAGAVVMMLKDANSSEVIKKVKERMELIKTTMPEGVEIIPFLDRTKMVNNAIQTVAKNLMEGALIVIFVLVLFLGNFRAGILVASVIPLSMLFAIIMMNMFGVSGNLMSLGALDFGLIVDGAVIIVESVMHYLHHNRKYHNIQIMNQHQMDTMVGMSAKKMMNSAVFGQIIILIVYLPIFTLQGIEGKMFKPMAQTVAFALIGAFILSLTYIPVMSSIFLSHNTHHNQNISERLMRYIESMYCKLLARSLRFQKSILFIVVCMFLFSLVLLSTMGGEFIPTLEEGDFAVDTRVLTGSNLSTSIAFTQKAAGVLKASFPEVECVVTKTGSGEVPTDPMPMEASDMMVILKDKKEWTSARTFSELASLMYDSVQQIPGITTGFQYPVQMRFNELMTGARQDVVCKIFGENLDSLSIYAEKVAHQIRSIPGAQNMYVENINGMPYLQIQYKYHVLSQYQLQVENINHIINASLAGQSAGLIFEDEKRFDIIVKLDPNKKKNIYDIKNILIPLNDGKQIPLHLIAEVYEVNGINQIQREDAKRRIVIGFNVRDRDIQSTVEELQLKIKNTVRFPDGYYISYGGSFENLSQAKKRLQIAVPISLLLIFILLYFTFHSIKNSLVIYAAIPLSAMGGIFLLYILDMPFSISAGIGFIALFGVAVLNGIVLVAEFNRLKEYGKLSIVHIIMRGTQVRLRPVLMTALVASLGFLPMAISNGSGSEVQRPLATVVIGGLLLATLLTLFVIPMLYMLSEIGIKNQLKNMKLLKQKSLLAIIILFFIFRNGNAQKIISIQEALRIAQSNNIEYQIAKKYTMQASNQIKAAINIPRTVVYSELGQVNSPMFDAKIGISQSFEFPSVYHFRNNYLKNIKHTASINEEEKWMQIKKDIWLTYITYNYLKEKEKYCIMNDSLYSRFLQVAQIRNQKGEAEKMEVSFAQIQKSNMYMQLIQIQQEVAQCMNQFNLLLQSSNQYIPELIYHLPTELLETIPDSNSIIIHPSVKLKQSYVQSTNQWLRLQRNKLAPDFTFAIYNTSFRGIASDNKYYTAAHRFTSIQAGISIPLFYGENKANIQNALILEKIAEQDKLETQLKIYTAIQNNWNQYINTKNWIAYYDSNTSNEIQTIRESAIIKYSLGEINYSEYIVLLQQTISIQVAALDNRFLHEKSAIELFYLTSNLP